MRSSTKDKLTFALNRIGTPAEEAEARAYIAEAGYVALNGCLLERPAYRKAQNTGHAITETSYAGLNAKADAVAGQNAGSVGQPAEGASRACGGSR
jgi:chromosome partitioning protein